ncbi:hypothetical protein HG530_000379 [Fusarium avenaceum]|nr:hypothetical protein HG530_000379 [Fusarium avenaceum]
MTTAAELVVVGGITTAELELDTTGAAAELDVVGGTATRVSMMMVPGSPAAVDVLGTPAGGEVEVSGPAVGVSIRTVPAPPSEIGGLYMVTVTEPDPPA